MAAESLATLAPFFSTVHGAATLVVTLGTAVVGLAAAFHKFRHEQFRKVPLEHLKMLQEAASGDELISRCMKQATHLEVARQTFGKVGTPAEANYLFRLMASQRFAQATLRAAAPYVCTDKEEVRVRPGILGGFLLVSSAVLTVAILALTAILMWAAYQMKTLSGTGWMLVFEVVGLSAAICMGRFTGNEIRAFYCAREADKLALGTTASSSTNSDSAPITADVPSYSPTAADVSAVREALSAATATAS